MPKPPQPPDPPLWSGTPVYDKERDEARLSLQRKRVWDVMKDAEWRTIDQVSLITGDPPQSVSASFRDFRKAKYGSHFVLRHFIRRGLHEYQLIINESSGQPT